MPVSAVLFHNLLLAGPLLGSVVTADAAAISAGQAWMPFLWGMGAVLLAAVLLRFGWRHWHSGR